MSYSFTVRAANKNDVCQKVSEELVKVSRYLTSHGPDLDKAGAVANIFVNLLREDADLDIRVTMHGSVWKDDKGFRQASVGVDASLVPRDV